MVFSAWYAELPGCSSQGDTEQEARENLHDAYELYISDLLESGLPIPPPASPAARIHEAVVYQVAITAGQTHQTSSTITYAPMSVGEVRPPFPMGVR
jgi:predicted RNase H-like HicB family nuclease